MGAIFQNALESLRKFWTGMTRGEKIRLVSIAGGIIVLSIVIVAILGRTEYAVIYSGTPEEAGVIAEQLRSQGERVRTQGANTVLVPEERLSDLGMSLAVSGYSTVGYDLSILAQASGLGMTDTNRREITKYQTMDTVRTNLKLLDSVGDCLVLLNVPEPSPYARSGRALEESSATVTIVPATAKTFGQTDADTVRQVIAAGTGIALQNIAVSDSSGRQYPYVEPGDEQQSTDVFAQRLRLKYDLEDLLRTQVETFLAPIFGDRAKASPSVTLDFDKKVAELIDFEPVVDESGIVLSSERLYEATQVGEEAEGVPGTDTNGMGTVEYPWEDIQDGETYRRYMETYNYEISRHTTQIEYEMGAIERLSVSVIVDDAVISDDYADTIIDLVTNAIGITDRNLVSVAFMPFNATNAFVDQIAEQEATMRAIQTRRLVNTGIICGLILIIVILGLLFARWVLRSRAQERRAVELAAQGVVAGAAVDYLADGDIEELAEVIEDEEPEPELGVNKKTEGLLQLEKFIDSNPEAVAQLLRNWLSEE